MFLGNPRRREEAERRLKGPAYPEPLRYLHDDFATLSMSRGASQVGLDPITPQAIEAYDRLMGLGIEPHEVEGLMQIDAAYRFPGDEE